MYDQAGPCGKDRDARSQKVGVWWEAARPPVIFSLCFNVNKTKLDGRFAKLERYFVGSMPFFIIDRVTSLRTDPPTYSECFLFRPMLPCMLTGSGSTGKILETFQTPRYPRGFSFRRAHASNRIQQFLGNTSFHFRRAISCSTVAAACRRRFLGVNWL